MQRSRQDTDGRAGVTLLELLLVMGLIATVFGAGLGAFAALDVQERQAVGVVKEALRTARNSALGRQVPAHVSIDAAAGTLQPARSLVIGTWAFERGDASDLVAGAFGIDGIAAGGAWIEDGWIGDGLDLSDDGLVEIPVRGLPSWDLSEGFSIELAVRRDDVGGGRLLRIGDTLGIDVGAAGEVRAWFVARLDVDGLMPREGGRVILETDPGVVPPARWVRLRFSYDRRQLELVADSIPRARSEEERAVWELDGPLILSDEDRPFPGAVDSLVVSAVAVEEVLELPDTVRIAEAPPELRFAANGALERTSHPTPVDIVLEFEDGSRETVTIGVYGTIE